MNLQPAGEYLGEDFYRAGGVPAVVGELLRNGLIDGDALTVNGRTHRRELPRRPASLDEAVIRRFDEPLKANAGLTVLRGNLFDSAIMKTSVISESFARAICPIPNDPDAFEGRVVVFDGPEDYHARIDDPSLGIDERTLLVMRGTGPHRLSRRRRSREHAAAGRDHSCGHRCSAVHRRWSAVGHVGFAVDSQCLARSCGRAAVLRCCARAIACASI